jgi:hypothetical protein
MREAFSKYRRNKKLQINFGFEIWRKMSTPEVCTMENNIEKILLSEGIRTG